MKSVDRVLGFVELPFPEKSWRDRLIAFLILILSALHFSLFYNFTLQSADEGIVLQGAERILHGQVLYRDFFSFLTPGSYYWHALFFKIFGSSILVARFVLIAEGALLSVFIYLLSRRVCSRWSACIASLAFMLTGLPNRVVVLHNWDSTFWACLTLYAAVLFLQNPRPLWIFATGWLAALTCLFEQPKGAGVVFGLALGFLILKATDHAMPRDRKASLFCALLVGFGAPFALTFAYFGIHHSFYQMAADWFWALQHYSSVNKTPYGFVVLSAEDRSDMYAGPWFSRLLTLVVTGPLFIIPALPFAAIAVLFYWTIKRWRANIEPNLSAYYVLIASTVVGLFLSILATGRADFTHFVFISPLLFVTLAWIIDGKMLPAFVVRTVAPLLNLGLMTSFLAFGLVLLTQPLNAVHQLETRRGTLKAMHPDEIVGYIQKNIPAGGTVLIYPYLPLYYYLTGTFSPGRYEYFQPGLHTREQLQELLMQLSADQTRMVFFEPSFREKLSAGFPATPAEVITEHDPVAEYLNLHYTRCAELTSAQQVWRFVAMVRKDLPCPSSEF